MYLTFFFFLLKLTTVLIILIQVNRQRVNDNRRVYRTNIVVVYKIRTVVRYKNI